MVKAIDSDLGNLNSVATGTSVSCKVAFSQLFLLNEYEWMNEFSEPQLCVSGTFELGRQLIWNYYHLQK